MPGYHLRHEQRIARPLEDVFAFFSDAENLQAITPPWLGFQIITPRPIEMAEGTEIVYRIRWRFLRMTWHSQITEWRPPHRFTDVQLRGPYSYWRHTHSFVPLEGGTNIIDEVHYGLPLGPLGAVVHRFKVRHDLAAIFEYRSARIRELLEAPATSPLANGHAKEKPFVRTRRHEPRLKRYYGR